MADSKITKAEYEASIREHGITHIDVSEMVKVGNGTFYWKHPASERYVEFKVVVKSEKFDDDALEALIEERRIIDEGKAARAAAALAKKEKDIQKREEKKQKENSK